MKEEKYAIITGATSGLGREFSYNLASKGYSLIIVGRREELLNNTAKEIKDKYKVNVIVKILDLSKESELREFIKETHEVEDVEFLINNAGHGAEESFMKDRIENIEEMIGVHILATARLCHAIAERMKKRKKGYIINLSSLASFNVFPTSAMYCATKSFLTSFSQSLAMELQPFNINVQALCPGFVRTDFHSRLKMDESKLKNKFIVRWMIPKEVVEISLKSIERRMKVIVIPGFWNKVIYQCLKFIPKRLYYKLASKSLDLI